LFAETYSQSPAHQLCYSTPGTIYPYTPQIHCDPGDPISSVDGLFNYPSNATDEWLSLWPHGGNSSGYYSPACDPSAFLRDCGDTSRIYYDFGQGAHFYRFLDYWFFYRYNSRADDDHEGDWEGVTIVLKRDPGLVSTQAVAGVIFWAHGIGTYHTASTLEWCADGAIDYTYCNLGSNTGHVATFVAGGSHASYFDWCATGCKSPVVKAGYQLDETAHDGSHGWPENDNTICTAEACVVPVTFIRETGTKAPRLPLSWANWPGRWGASTEGIIPGVGSSPGSPGSQHPYQCTQTGWICGTRLGGDPLPVP
jgi:hypothetical protein